MLNCWISLIFHHFKPCSNDSGVIEKYVAEQLRQELRLSEQEVDKQVQVAVKPLNETIKQQNEQT